MPLKGLTKRLKKTFSFRSRGGYDLNSSVDPALRQYKPREADRLSGESDIYRPGQDYPLQPGISGVGIGSTNSLQQQPPLTKPKPNNRGSVGSLNDLPTVEIENLPPIKLVKEITYSDQSLTLPTKSKPSKVEKVTAGEIKHFKRGVQLADRIDEDPILLEDNSAAGTSVEHNLIYQGVGFRNKKVAKVDNKVVDNSPNFEEFDDPNYSTIPHFLKPKSKTEFNSPGNVSNELNERVLTSASSIRRDFDEAGYSTVPEARAAAVQSIFSTDTDFVNISNFCSIPEATVSLDEDPGYETLDETKKKVDNLKRQSDEYKTRDNKLVLVHKVRQTESTAVQTDDIYDNNLISPLRETSNPLYDNVNQTPLVSPESCVSGYNSLGNSPSSPPNTNIVTGASILSSQEKGIEGAVPVFTLPHLVKLNSSQSAFHNTKKPLHVATLVTITGEPNQHTFALDEEATPGSGIDQKPASQDIGVNSPDLDNVEDGLYSTIGNRTDKDITIDKPSEVMNECQSEPVDMDSEDIAPPIPSRNYLLEDSPNTTVLNSGSASKSVGCSLDHGLGALNISHKGTDIDSGALNIQENLEVKGEINENKGDIPTGPVNQKVNDLANKQCVAQSQTSKARLSLDSPDELDRITDETGETMPNLPVPKLPTDDNQNLEETSSSTQSEQNGMRVNVKRTSESDTSDNHQENQRSGDYQNLNSSSDRPTSGTSGSGSSNPNSPGGNSIDDSQVDLIYSFKELKQSGWYWGPLSAGEAEAKLANKPDGSFLVRDSSDERYILSISFNSQGSTHHTRIEHYKGHFSFYSQPTSHGYGTITEFIERVMQHSRNGSFSYFLRPSAPGSPPMQVRLLYPVSRLRVMRSLQHMCRFVIVKYVRIDHMDSLPLPERVRTYLKEQQYYIEFLED